jgi:Zinc dependent phospholipase C
MPPRAASRKLLGCLLVIFLAGQQPLAAYSVLSHETIVDAAWNTELRPLLQKRFPRATPDELRKAHAYAYGGAIIQDLGYYPHGSKFFSDLTHYVRSGDFIQALLRGAHDLNEYAFALGALAHYAADNEGHRLAVNLSVPLLYPKLERKYGHTVTYEEDPAAHLKTEFGFDVLEVAKGHFAPDAYHDFIGFEVAQPLLDRAFRETYGLELASVLDNEPRAIGSYRHDVSSVIPKATRVAWALKRNEIQRDLPTMTRKRFLYNLSRASYEKEWGKDYRAPTAGEKFLAFLFRLIPKIGPLRALALRTPTPQTEQMFERSFNASLAQYRQLLADWDRGRLVLVNDNFDVGAVTPPGQYRLNDNTHAALLDRLSRQGFAGTPAELRSELLQFYNDPSAPYATKNDRKAWNRLQGELQRLRATQPANGAAEIHDQPARMDGRN